MSKKAMISKDELVAQQEVQTTETEMEQIVDEVIDDVEEEVFPGGPARAEVEQWKARFGEVYSSQFDDDVYIWRVMTRQEYKEILRIQKADAMYREERICERCVLWPRNYNHVMMTQGKAGIPTLLAEQIMDKSGFVPTGDPQKL
jgi:hypothetical protein